MLGLEKNRARRAEVPTKRLIACRFKQPRQKKTKSCVRACRPYQFVAGKIRLALACGSRREIAVFM